MKYLWLISQDVNGGYDTFDSAVVVAETEQQAKETFPGDYPHVWKVDAWYHDNGDKVDTRYGCWATPDQVTARYIGVARPSLPIGSVISSFNAG